MSVKERAEANMKVLKMAYGGVLVALGILLPQAFHVFGQNAGMTFLPIQIPILFAGLLLGPSYGAAIGLLVPVLSSVLTGMPPVPKLYFLLAELGAYGLVTGWMMKWTGKVYVSLITAMVCGRICYGISLLAGLYLLHMNAPFMNQAAYVGGILTGIPGMMIQIIVIPLLYMALKRGGFTFEQ